MTTPAAGPRPSSRSASGKDLGAEPAVSSVHCFRFSDQPRQHRHIDVARATYGPGQPTCLVHTHDYPEVFWVDSGTGQHWVNGQRSTLSPGDMVFMRSRDVHCLERGEGTYTITNVAVPGGVLERLRSHIDTSGTSWPWSDGPMPTTFHLPPSALQSLREVIDRFDPDVATPVDRDWLLLGILRQVMVQHHEVHRDDLPIWIRDLLVAMNDATHLQGGTHALVRLAGYSREHVNRMLQKHLGTSCSGLVNRLRCEYAANRLRLTSDPIIAIANECGFQSLTNFYRCFSERYGMSPRRWRRRWLSFIQIEE